MKHWQYIVTIFVLLGCSSKPAPDDSYIISQNDYSDVTAETTEIVNQGDSIVQIVMPDSLIAGTDTLSASLTPEDSLVLLEDSLAAELDSIQAEIDSLTSDDIPETWRFIEIEIQGSLYQSLGVVADVDPDILGAHCVRNLVWEMNPWTGFIAGDSMRIIYTLDELPRENMVIAFEYIPVGGSANQYFSGYVFQKSGDNWPSVWKPDGSELVKLLDRSPVRTFEEITSVFGEPRGNHIHQGVDYKAPVETPVFSVTGGTVLRTNWNTTYNGYCVELDFGGYSEVFLHLFSIGSGVVNGAVIEPGGEIGTVGNTGTSTAPHLHYQINGPDGYAIDPYLYFRSHRRTLGEVDMADFQRHIDLCLLLMGD